MIGVKGDGVVVTKACRLCDCEVWNILFEEEESLQLMFFNVPTSDRAI